MQFNNFKHYVTIVMTMIVLLIYLAVLNLVLPTEFSMDEPNIVIEPTINELILYVVVLTILHLFGKKLYSEVCFYKIISAFFYTYWCCYKCFHIYFRASLTLASVLYIFGMGVCLAYTYKNK